MKLFGFFFLISSLTIALTNKTEAAFNRLHQREKDRMLQCATYLELTNINGVICKNLIGTQKNAAQLRLLQQKVQEQVSKMTPQELGSNQDIYQNFIGNLSTVCLRGFKACKYIYERTREKKWNQLRRVCNQLCSARTCGEEFTLAGCRILSIYHFNPDINTSDLELDESDQPILDNDGNVVPAEGSEPVCPKEYVKNCLAKNTDIVDFENEDALGLVASQMLKDHAAEPASGQTLTYRIMQGSAAVAAVAAAVAFGPLVINKVATLAQSGFRNPLDSLNMANRVKSLGSSAKGFTSQLSDKADIPDIDSPSMPDVPSVRTSGGGGTSVGIGPRSIGAGGSGYAHAR
jgi:hypothetical protein